MAASVLIVTPERQFGERLRAKVGRSGWGDLRVTDDFAEAIRTTRQRHCPLALLDAEMEHEGVSVTDIGYALRQINPEIQYIIIQNSEGEIPTGVDALGVAAALPAFFEFSSFEALVMQLLPEVAAKNAAPSGALDGFDDDESDTELPWLADVNRAAQHLTRLTLESSAQAALITRDHELWAYAGQFPRAAAQEMAASIQRHWEREEKTDLLRFIRLAATNAEHMLYATRLTADLILALVFDSETPFSTIRSQAGKLASSLSSSPSDTASAGGHKRESDLDELEDIPHLSSVLADVPAPDPIPLPDQLPAGKREPAPAEKVPANHLSALFAGPLFNLEPAPQPTSGSASQTSYEIADGSLRADLDVRETSLQDAAQLAETRENKVQPSQDTRPSSAGEVTRRIVLEPASPAVYNLDYACLLIPRFDHHYLTGALAESLPEWMQQTCVAFGWRLEHIAVRPDYLQWVVSVPPTVSPGHVMRIVRQQTSENLFAELPRYRKENPSGDFWAPSYIIMGGSQPPPQSLIKDFILQTRRRQGIIRSR